MNALWILLTSDMYHIAIGKVAPQIIAITTNDDPSLVSGPRFLMLNAKIVGNMIEWKKPIATTAHTETIPVMLIAMTPQIAEPPANKASSIVGDTFCIISEPRILPIMNPRRCQPK